MCFATDLFNTCWWLSGLLAGRSVHAQASPQSQEASPEIVDVVAQATEGTDNMTNGVLEMLDAREKLQ